MFILSHILLRKSDTRISNNSSALISAPIKCSDFINEFLTNSHDGEGAVFFFDELRRSAGKEAREELQRWLILVTNTIQSSHSRNIRNPIRGFDLHKPTLYRVTRGQRSHLSGAIKMAQRREDLWQGGGSS